MSVLLYQDFQVKSYRLTKLEAAQRITPGLAVLIPTRWAVVSSALFHRSRGRLPWHIRSSIAASFSASDDQKYANTYGPGIADRPG